MIIKFNEFEEKVIQGIKFKENFFKELDKEINFEEYLKKLEKNYNINEYNYFEDSCPREYQKMVKEYDFNYYTVRTMNNLKKKERLINRFIEYIESVENSEDKNIIAEIEQDRKNENKRQKLKNLKLKQQQIHENKNKKAMERNAKFVVIGRPVPKIYQFNKSKNLRSNKDNQNRNDMDLLFFNDDDEK